MRRFFTEPENIHDNYAVILEDAAHITRVLRMKPGDLVLLFDGTGYEYAAILEEISPGRCTAVIESRVKSLQEPQIKVTLFQGIPKAGKMETIVQKAVELGVYKIVPVTMERCVSKLDMDKSGTQKLQRWQKISAEAAKQCGRGILPTVEPPLSFSQSLERLKSLELAIMPYEVLGHQGDQGLKALLQQSTVNEIGVLIGPEGGFSDNEAVLAREAGIHQIGLGRRILRTETAGSTLLSIIMYEKNEM